MNDFIKDHLIELKKKNFSNPEIELKTLLNYSAVNNKNIFLCNFDINQIDLDKFNSFFERRISSEPLSKIIQNKEFWSYNFFVNNKVLDPRPETEFLIEAVKKYFLDHDSLLKICDLGTGSGCLAIVLAKIYKKSKVIATDISNEAIKVAKINNKKYNLTDQIEFINCNWISTTEEFDLIVSNPPYLSYHEYINCDDGIKLFEPKEALEAGSEGLDAYKEMASIVSKIMHINSLLFLEIGKDKKNDVLSIFNNYDMKKVEIIKDYQSIDRVLVMKKT